MPHCSGSNPRPFDLQSNALPLSYQHDIVKFGPSKIIGYCVLFFWCVAGTLVSDVMCVADTGRARLRLQYCEYCNIAIINIAILSIQQKQVVARAHWHCNIYPWATSRRVARSLVSPCRACFQFRVNQALCGTRALQTVALRCPKDLFVDQSATSRRTFKHNNGRCPAGRAFRLRVVVVFVPSHGGTLRC